MKEVKTERSVYDIHYEAIDGTIFYNKEECEKYDRTAEAVLRQRFNGMIVKEGTEYSLFGMGNDDATVYAIRMEEESDAFTMKQLWEHYHEYMNNTSRYSELQKKAYDRIDTAYQEMDILFVAEDCEHSLYIINTMANMIEDLQNIDKKKDEPEGKNS